MWALDAYGLDEAKDSIVLLNCSEDQTQAWALTTLTLLQPLRPPCCSSLTWASLQPRAFALALSLPGKPPLQEEGLGPSSLSGLC